MKIPRTPERRITPLFGSVRFCSRKGHSLAIFAHTPSPIVLAESAEDYSWEIAEWQLARRSIGAGYAEVWHSATPASSIFNLFRGRARPADCCKATHARRGAAHRAEHREVAGFAASWERGGITPRLSQIKVRFEPSRYRFAQWESTGHVGERLLLCLATVSIFVERYRTAHPRLAQVSALNSKMRKSPRTTFAPK